MKTIVYYLFWLVPAALFGLGVHQAVTLRNVESIFKDGTEHLAQVEDFKIKHIASQTNGYVIVRFTNPQGQEVVKKLSLTVQLAARIMEAKALSVKYLPGTGNEVILTQTYSVHRNMIRVNLIIIAVSFIVTLGIVFGWKKWREKPASGAEVVFEK